MVIGMIAPTNYFPPFELVKSIVSLRKWYEFVIIQSHSVPDNRNRVWDIMLAKYPDEDLLFIDTDTVFVDSDVQKIEQHLKTYDIITGLYVLANEVPAIFRRGETDYEFIKPELGLFKIDACGAGFLGISKRTYRKLPKNPFSNFHEGEIIHGEDVSFCFRAGKAGIPIFCDSSLKLGHVRTWVFKPE